MHKKPFTEHTKLLAEHTKQIEVPIKYSALPLGAFGESISSPSNRQ